MTVTPPLIGGEAVVACGTVIRWGDRYGLALSADYLRWADELPGPDSAAAVELAPAEELRAHEGHEVRVSGTWTGSMIVAARLIEKPEHSRVRAVAGNPDLVEPSSWTAEQVRVARAAVLRLAERPEVLSFGDPESAGDGEPRFVVTIKYMTAVAAELLDGVPPGVVEVRVLVSRLTPSVA